MLARTTRSLLSQAAAAFDLMATKAAYAGSSRRRRKSRSESLSHDQRMEALSLLGRAYEGVDTATLFREPRSVMPTWLRQRRTDDGGQVCDLRWPSDYEPLIPQMRERYDAGVENRQAAARMWLHPEPRPAVVLVHGYLAGRHAFEERTWPTSWFYGIGLDVALFVLPFHGVRAVKGRVGAPQFPGSDPRMTIEGFRQAIGDLRDLVSWLRERDRSHVGVMGMSLGGYTTALAATAEPKLSFAVPVIPLTSIADFARDQGRLGSNATEEALEYDALDAVYRLVSPLHRESVVEPHRTMIIAAEADRITPLAHAERLAGHFGAQLKTWHGGHLLQFGRSEQFREVGRFLNRLGIIER